MLTPSRPLLGAFVAALAAVAVAYPALSLVHTFEHVYERSASESSGHLPEGEASAEALCGLCLSLSPGRAALAPTSMLVLAAATSVDRVDPPPPPALPARSTRAPEAPRAPPLG